MPSATRIGNRLVSRSATEASAPSNSLLSSSAPINASTTSASAPLPTTQTSTSRLQPRQSTQPSVDKSNSAHLHAASSRHSPPLSVMMRRYWKKLNEKDSSGKRTRISQAFAAFKMGLYFKVFITLVLILRFASHSSQRAYPSASIMRDDHFLALASAPVSPNVRIIVITETGYSDTLPQLLQSIADADYERDSAAIDVWMFASSPCNYIPLPLYPLAMAVFGPPRFDHSVPPIVQSLVWRHGTKSLIAVRSEPDWTHVWESNRGTINETLLFIDGKLTRSVSPAYYTWLKRARTAIQRGMVANAAVYSLDAITVPDGVPPRDAAVLLDQFFPATAAFSPTQDAWITFQKWFAVRTRSWFARPSLPRDLHLGGYGFLDALRMQPARAWFAQFLATYGERVVHASLAKNESLVVRKAGSTCGGVAGSGDMSHVHLELVAEMPENRFVGTLKDVGIPERPVVIKVNGSVTTADDAFGSTVGKIAGRSRRAVIEDIVDLNAAAKYRDTLRRIGEFARSRGSEVISFTMVTAAFLDTTLSWLCNVAVLDMGPPALVLVTSEDSVAEELKHFLKQYGRLQQGSLVVSMQGAVAALDKHAAKEALHFGTSEYWMLMLQRTFLLRDLLERGLSILQFETDQIWLSDPMPYIRHELGQGRSNMDGGGRVEDYRIADLVVTVNTLDEVAGNFLYLRPTVGTRQLMSKVVDRFLNSYRSSRSSRAARLNRFHYIANDQSILTRLVTGRDWRHARLFPKVKANVLNRELFVDGQWFSDFEDKSGKMVNVRRHYTSDLSLYPVVVNNNFLIGVQEKMKRAKRFGYWFVRKGSGSGSGSGNNKSQENDSGEMEYECDVSGVRRAARTTTRTARRSAVSVNNGDSKRRGMRGGGEMDVEMNRRGLHDRSNGGRPVVEIGGRVANDGLPRQQQRM